MKKGKTKRETRRTRIEEMADLIEQQNVATGDVTKIIWLICSESMNIRPESEIYGQVKLLVFKSQL